MINSIGTYIWKRERKNLRKYGCKGWDNFVLPEIVDVKDCKVLNV